ALLALLRDEQRQPLDAGREADPRDVGTSELLHQSVVASAAGHGVLGAETGSGDRLVRRARVVIEAAHQLRVHDEGNPQAVERLLHPGEVRLARVAEKRIHLRRPRGDFLALGVLAVEHADGIGLGALAAVLTKVAGAGAQIRLERLPVPGAAGAVAERVQVHRERDPERLQPAVEHLDLLRIDPRARIAERLDADLRELAVAPPLLPLPPEHGADVPPLGLRLLLIDVVLDVGAHQRGRVLRPQGHRVAAVVEGVHLLADDVGDLADAADEELGSLQDRRARLAVSVEGKEVAGGLLDELVVPDADPRIVVLHVGVDGQDVAGALHAADLLAHGDSSASPSLIASPGRNRSASFTPGAKRTTTVEPISNTASSPPFSTRSDRSYSFRSGCRVRRALVTTSS